LLQWNPCCRGALAGVIGNPTSYRWGRTVRVCDPYDHQRGFSPIKMVRTNPVRTLHFNADARSRHYVWGRMVRVRAPTTTSASPPQKKWCVQTRYAPYFNADARSHSLRLGTHGSRARPYACGVITARGCSAAGSSRASRRCRSRRRRAPRSQAHR